jgi:tripartite-type tricarboxylate transporter receptor subunit TctC
VFLGYAKRLWMPKRTPKEPITRLNSAVQTALADATVQQRFADQGQDIPPREQQAPEALAAQQKAEIEKWWPIREYQGGINPARV